MEAVAINTGHKAAVSDDYRLIQLAVAGDQLAFSQLMDRYRDSIYRTIKKMVSNKEDADDLTLEAFGKAFRNLESYRPKYAFSTWLFRIAINNCIDTSVRSACKRSLSMSPSKRIAIRISPATCGPNPSTPRKWLFANNASS